MCLYLHEDMRISSAGPRWGCREGVTMGAEGDLTGWRSVSWSIHVCCVVWLSGNYYTTTTVMLLLTDRVTLTGNFPDKNIFGMWNLLAFSQSSVFQEMRFRYKQTFQRYIRDYRWKTRRVSKAKQRTGVLISVLRRYDTFSYDFIGDFPQEIE